MKKKNANYRLIDAKQRKKDEFYTQLSDIESELIHYERHFEGSVVYCNCDEPEESNFCRYFYDNFRKLKLSKLIVSGFRKNAQGVCLTYDGRISENYLLTGDGDFLSEECTSMLRQSDIIVTNPPFSMFRDHIAQLTIENKRFVVIANMNALTYKEIFNLILRNKIWLGMTGFNDFSGFVVPETYDLYGTRSRIDENGKRIVSTNNTCWFTNLNTAKENQFLKLDRMYSPEVYPYYDNYDAIEVSRVSDIPCDFSGVMGVPITFIYRHNPDQFEILGWASGKNEYDVHPIKKYAKAKQHNRDSSIVKGTKVNTRAALHYSEIPDGVYYTADNVEGYLSLKYARIFIKSKFQSSGR